MKKEKAIVLFSGGLDSTTTLFWAKTRFHHVRALTFHYSQKHCIEVRMAEEIARRQEIPLTVVKLPFQDFTESALIDPEIPVPDCSSPSPNPPSVPSTYVPFRNGIFLSIATAMAEKIHAPHLVTGFNTIDSPEYPDTSPRFTRKMNQAINNGCAWRDWSSRPLKIHTPLIRLSKVEIIRMGIKLHADYSHSISCYRGSEIPCDSCSACHHRSSAFETLGVMDPLVARLKGDTTK